MDAKQALIKFRNPIWRDGFKLGFAVSSLTFIALETWLIWG